MYQAKLHPEQYSNTFSDTQVKQLHDAMMYVCNTAVDTLAESDKFPEDWLMKYRWDKGKKNGSKLPNGAKITFLKVGGRTSAIVPSVQKKTGAVAGDITEEAEEADGDEEESVKIRTKGRKRKSRAKEEDDSESEEVLPVSTKRGRNKKTEQAKKEDEEDEEILPASKKHKMTRGTSQEKDQSTKSDQKSTATGGRRRSGRK